ncbi:hypothetical protein [Micromonospora sp. NPDC023956]|uniref:hypothetical protein n=1 Tax=Micromonospora sp. NPDC023956 TaxID=3155722 RepID=UPI0034079329
MRRVPSVRLGAPRAERIYLAGPSAESWHATRDRFRAPYDFLVGRGYLVVVAAANHPRGGDLDEVLGAVSDDMDALAAADYLVLLPGSEHLWEAALAPALGVPVLAVTDFVEMVAA